MRVIQKALTFDDVLLVPAHSTVLPREVSLETRLTRTIQLKIPLTSAAMDTVTEARLAIALAQEGGIGIIHKNMPPEAQAAEVARVKRFVKYSVDRWGAYIDFWEILNEQNADDRWYAIVAPYLHSVDPYHHPVATSWERPKLDGIDVCSPHWYSGRDDYKADHAVEYLAGQWKRFGKPVIVTEQGNVAAKDPASRPAEVGGCWDPTSHTRMRIRIWWRRCAS